ncbi:C-C motif chemokine 19-like [Nothoprocta perdicaria]|uniref:C-C motif chemokine 19-like n=1 Tax=Nothoprocta perdicaria TaxID=30464 RepID=UPI000E1B7539|nr:C-C motif chemokine 19-like [Nothoprocta perdicaria]
MRCPPLLFLSLFLLGCVLDVSVANNVVDCCLRTSENHIPWRIVQDYRLQLVQDGCIIPATVFITMKGKRLCAPLEAPWVIRLRERLDASSPRKGKPQGQLELRIPKLCTSCSPSAQPHPVSPITYR